MLQQNQHSLLYWHTQILVDLDDTDTVESDDLVDNDSPAVVLTVLHAVWV